VVDAKLARSAKARAVLQTSFYSRLLANVQPVEPRLQVAREDDGSIHEMLAPERQSDNTLVPNRGLLALPEPADGACSSISRGPVTTRKTGANDVNLVRVKQVPDRAEWAPAGPQDSGCVRNQVEPVFGTRDTNVE